MYKGRLLSLSSITKLLIRILLKKTSRNVTEDTLYPQRTSKLAKWTPEEEVVLLYYASRRVNKATLMNILDKKCSPKVRTAKQISHKVLRLRRLCGQKEFVRNAEGSAPKHEWDRKLVDQWLLSKMEKAKVEPLIEFDGETAAMIGESNNLDDFVDIMNLEDGGQPDQPDQPDHTEQPEQSEQPEQPEKDEEQGYHHGCLEP